ncbi:hypothetical protein ABZP36_001014 [Zizania latifolia]
MFTSPLEERKGRSTSGTVDSAQGRELRGCLRSQWKRSDREARIADVARSERRVFLLRGDWKWGRRRLPRGRGNWHRRYKACPSSASVTVRWSSGDIAATVGDLADPLLDDLDPLASEATISEIARMSVHGPELEQSSNKY